MTTNDITSAFDSQTTGGKSTRPGLRRSLPLILSSAALLVSIAAFLLPPSSRQATNDFQPSSRRWKTNVNPLVQSLDKVKRLQGVAYTWDREHGGARDIGFIAEDVRLVVPEVVKMESNSASAESLDYGHLTALLVESVKELSRQNDDLRRQIEQMRNDNQAFQNRMNANMNRPHVNPSTGQPTLPGIHHNTN
ncbi:tail fiber domain-containing protein [Candidatus Sumerlaeota bacterium]|nr:tail fiber domain-containing protein [Candidatus Sumerlaeota bacterium]